MAKKVRHRTVRADDGSSVQFTVVTSDGSIVEDDRNGVTVVDSDGTETFVPVSAQAARNTGAWFNSGA